MNSNLFVKDIRFYFALKLIGFGRWGLFIGDGWIMTSKFVMNLRPIPASYDFCLLIYVSTCPAFAMPSHLLISIFVQELLCHRK